MKGDRICSRCKGYYYAYYPEPDNICRECGKGETPTCPDCGVLVPRKLAPDATIWHPAIPCSEGQYMASVEGVGVIGMNRCTETPK